MGYIALRTQKLGEGDYRKAGDPVPEAADWPNVRAHITTGRIAFVPDDREGEVRHAIMNGLRIDPSLLPGTSLRFAQLASRGRLSVGAPPTKAVVKAAAKPAVPKPDPVVDPEPPPPKYVAADLKKMRRGALDKLARKEFGLADAADYASKDDLIATLLA